MAKLLEEEDKRSKEEYQTLRRTSKNHPRHWSLNDLNNHRKHDSEIRVAKLRKWNSLSNDELTNQNTHKHSLSNTRVPDLRTVHGGKLGQDTNL